MDTTTRPSRGKILTKYYVVPVPCVLGNMYFPSFLLLAHSGILFVSFVTFRGEYYDVRNTVMLHLGSSSTYILKPVGKLASLSLSENP